VHRNFAADVPSIHVPCVETLAFFAICRDHPSTMRESLYFRPLPRQLPWVIGLAVVMAVIGPFGSYLYMSLPIRLLYFVLVGVAFWLLIAATSALLVGWEGLRRWPLPLRLALAGFLASAPGTASIYLVHALLAQPIPLRYAPEVFIQSAFLSVVISVVLGLIIEWRLHAEADLERARVAAAADAGSTPQPAPDFFRRIPPALGRDLMALQMEDHYLRIHTALGSDLILLRLRDALAELGPQRGRQVHRSWWVAEKAVASVERDAGKMILILRNGLRVPVSKSFRDQVKEAGWLG
jgi:LytTr DNA-binding domain